jgi:uncharacterized protein (TIGR02594 family)
MPEFNPLKNEGATPDFTGSSRGIEGGRVQPDTSVADLFSGLGEGLLLGVQAADQGIQAEIQEDAQDAFAQLDNEFGVTSAAMQENRADADDIWGQAEATPSELRNAETQLSGLHAAMQSGQLKESHYWARAQSIVRQLKGRYPGYQEQIDTMVGSITGVRPANALRRALFDEWGAGAGDGEKRRQSLIASMADDGSLENAAPDFWERERAGNGYTTAELMEAQSGWNQEENANKKRQSRLSVAKANGELTSDEVYKTFRDEVNTKGRLMLQQGLTKFEAGQGGTLLELVAEAQIQASQGKDIDAETARRLGQAAELTRGQYDAAFEALLDQQWHGSDDPNDTYRRNMTPTQIEDARKEFMKPLDRIERALTHQQLGILNQAALQHEARKQDVTNSFVEENPELDILFVLPEIYGAAVVEQVLAANPKLRTVVAELTHRIIVANNHIGDHSGDDAPNVADDLEQIRNDDKISDADAADVTNAITQRHQNIVKNIGTEHELPNEVLAKELSYIFNEQNFKGLNALSPEARRQFFSRVASPEVTKKMKVLQKEGRTELWDMYQTYVAHEFETLFQEDVAAIQDRVLQPDAYDINWNPQKMRFEFTPNPNLSPITRRNMEQAGLFSELEEARRSINAGIQVVAPIIEANDRDAAIELYRLMHDMGLDESADPEETTVFQGMMEALELQFMLGAEDVRKGDLPLLGIRGAERLGKNVSDFTEPLRKSIWDTLRPFSAPFRAPEERRGDQGGQTRSLSGSIQPTSSPSNPKLDQRLTELRTEYPQAVAALQNSMTAPNFDELPWMYRLKLRQEASALGVSPQEVIDRAHAMANNTKKGFVLPSGRTLEEVIPAATTPADLAKEFIGANEGIVEDNNALSSFFQKTAGISINPAVTPWCAAFANAVLKSFGQEGTGSLAAKSFLDYGEAVDTPEVGDLVIFDRGKPGSWQGHVGFFQGYDESGNILVLGGNQGPTGSGAVNVKAYSPKRLEGFRRPPQINAKMNDKDKKVLRQIGLPKMTDVPYMQQLDILETVYG